MIFQKRKPSDYFRRIAKAGVQLVVLSIGFAAKATSAEHLVTTPDSLGSIKHRNIKGEDVDLFVWHPQYRERCYFQGRENVQNKSTETIKELLELLKRESALATYLLDRAEDLNAAFCIHYGDNGTRGYYDHKFNIVVIGDFQTFFEKLIMFVHELRHVDQVSRGFCQSLDYDMEEVARLIFAIEADVQGIVTLYAWRMKENGAPEVWNALSELEGNVDIAEAFEKEMKTSGDELKATEAAFAQWYKSKRRIDGYYESSCMAYLDLLDETKLIQRYAKLPKNYFDKLCILPSGENYGCHLTEEIKERPRNTLQDVRERND